VNPVRKTLLLSQALWAKYTLRLAPEAPGERHGVVSPSSFVPEASARPLRLVAIGDSLVAGSGVEHQDLALTPRIARKIADAVNWPVQWETHAKLGSTMRRVRYRFLPEVTGHTDILFICAGSNDVMARRSKEEWLDDLRAVIEQARTRADHVIVCSSGQPHHSPKLPARLRRELARRIDWQTAASLRICREYGVDFVDVAHAELVSDFWATDGFHPSASGYEQASGLVVQAMSFLPEMTATIR